MLYFITSRFNAFYYHDQLDIKNQNVKMVIKLRSSFCFFSASKHYHGYCDGSKQEYGNGFFERSIFVFNAYHVLVFYYHKNEKSAETLWSQNPRTWYFMVYGIV